MNKTHTITALPCGCVVVRWLFGSDLRPCSLAHAQPRRSATRHFLSQQPGSTPVGYQRK
jgi:hypothetical protein